MLEARHLDVRIPDRPYWLNNRSALSRSTFTLAVLYSDHVHFSNILFSHAVAVYGPSLATNELRVAVVGLAAILHPPMTSLYTVQ